ncbi:hypothetical protein IAT38_008252 [Cryptococcus sp. DSM 104549]
MAAYKNTYKAPPPDEERYPKDIHLHTPLEEYDHNFCLEVKQLSSDRVELRPFIPSLHAQLLLDGVLACDQAKLFNWLPMVKWETISDVLIFVESQARVNFGVLLYAVFSAPKDSVGPVDPADYQFAGTCALIDAEPSQLTVEIGCMIILEPFQRTHVNTHTTGLLMHRILDLPADGGLGFRRAMWGCSLLNVKSSTAAQRLGFKHEAVLRCRRIAATGKTAGTRPGRKGDPHENNWSGDSWWSSVIWTDWEEGVREHIDKLMART